MLLGLRSFYRPFTFEQVNLIFCTYEKYADEGSYECLAIHIGSVKNIDQRNAQTHFSLYKSASKSVNRDSYVRDIFRGGRFDPSW